MARNTIGTPPEQPELSGSFEEGFRFSTKKTTPTIDQKLTNVLKYYVTNPDLKGVIKRVKKVVASELPDTIDLEAKYETTNGIHLKLTGKDKWDSEQINHLARYADDQGFNRCLEETTERLA